MLPFLPLLCLSCSTLSHHPCEYILGSDSYMSLTFPPDVVSLAPPFVWIFFLAISTLFNAFVFLGVYKSDGSGLLFRNPLPYTSGPHTASKTTSHLSQRVITHLLWWLKPVLPCHQVRCPIFLFHNVLYHTSLALDNCTIQYFIFYIY